MASKQQEDVDVSTCLDGYHQASSAFYRVLIGAICGSAEDQRVWQIEQ